MLRRNGSEHRLRVHACMRTGDGGVEVRGGWGRNGAYGFGAMLRDWERVSIIGENKEIEGKGRRKDKPDVRSSVRINSVTVN